MEDGILRLDRDAVPDKLSILRSCSSLVRMSTSGQELEFAHFTVKEFLLGIGCDSEFSAYRVHVEESEVDLGKVCLRYLTLQDFDSGVPWSPEAQLKRFREYAFRHYAVKNWLSHASCRLGDPGLLTLIKGLLHPLEPGTFKTWTEDHHYIFKIDPAWHGVASTEDIQRIYTAVATATPLHYASAFALPEICKWLLDNKCEVDHMSRFGTPLNHALGGPSSLLSDFQSAQPEALSERQKERRLEVIDILLAAGGDPNSKSSEGVPPLHYAFSDQGIIQRLLQRGAETGYEKVRAKPFKAMRILLSKDESRRVDAAREVDADRDELRQLYPELKTRNFFDW